MDRREMLKGAAIPVFSAGVGWTAVFVPDPKPYDPVAVLEAMRERGFIVEVGNANAAKKPWLASILGQHGPEFCTNWLPDFRSAVLWLHKQAAAVDAEFARLWPVPAEVKQDG